MEEFQSSTAIMDFTKTNFEKEISICKELDVLLTTKKVFLREKAKVWWLNDSDRNTKFFHSLVKIWGAKSLVLIIGYWLCYHWGWSFAIKKHILEYYRGRFSENSEIPIDFNLVDKVILNLVTKRDNSSTYFGFV